MKLRKPECGLFHSTRAQFFDDPTVRNGRADHGEASTGDSYTAIKTMRLPWL